MKSRRLYYFIFSFLIITTIACTIPIYFGEASVPEEKIVYVEITSTPIPTESSADESSNTATQDTSTSPTATVSVSLDGAWTIWQGSSEQLLSINFLQTGYEIVGNTATGNGNSLLFNGVISQDGSAVSGNWENTDGTSGSFAMYLDNNKTSFSGNLGGGVPFCGTRSGSTKPSPCIN